MSVTTLMIAGTVVFALIMGLRGGRGKGSALEQWSIGGRSFGSILVFLLMAGEIYTTFTFLGASGYAYGKGAASYYILCYFPMAYIVSYWLLPPIWRYARDHGIISQAGFFARKYNSVPLGLLVTCVGVIALVPYLVLQLKGLGIIMTTASYGAVSPTLGILLGTLVITTFVAVSGIHGPASLALIKDVLIVAVIVFLGLYLPYRVAGGIGPMFQAVERSHPGFLAFPASGQSVAWFDSTVALTALGFFMWPHSFTSVFTARDERTMRQNAVIAPLYGLMLLFALFVGFAALLRVPGLTGKAIDLALFKAALAELPPVAVGLIGIAGVLTALVPGSMMLTTARSVRVDVLRQQHGVGAHQFGRPIEPVGDCGDFRDQVAGAVGVCVVVGVADVEHRVEQLFFGFEVMQQPGRTDPGLPGDLGQRRRAPPVAGQQPLRHGQDPLFAILALARSDSYGRVWGIGLLRSNQLTEHTVGWLEGCDKGRSRSIPAALATTPAIWR